MPADWSQIVAGKLVVGNDLGAFVSSPSGGKWTKLGSNLPAVPVVHITQDPANPNRIVVATFGRGVWSYTF